MCSSDLCCVFHFRLTGNVLIFNELLFRISTSSTCWAVHDGFYSTTYNLLQIWGGYNFKFSTPIFSTFYNFNSILFLLGLTIGDSNQKCSLRRLSYSVDTIIIIHKSIENSTIILSIISLSLFILLKNFLYFNFFNELFGT